MAQQSSYVPIFSEFSCGAPVDVQMVIVLFGGLGFVPCAHPPRNCMTLHCFGLPTAPRRVTRFSGRIWSHGLVPNGATAHALLLERPYIFVHRMCPLSVWGALGIVFCFSFKGGNEGQLRRPGRETARRETTW